MKLSKLIQQLQNIQDFNGDVDVIINDQIPYDGLYGQRKLMVEDVGMVFDKNEVDVNDNVSFPVLFIDIR